MKEPIKGKEYLCIKTVVMDSKYTAYIKGKVYISEQNRCITNEKNNANHFWTKKGMNKFFTETQETFGITKETIIKYKMKDEFPEVFEVKLENNTWYVCHHYSSRHLVNLNITDESDTHNKGFGFDSHGKWTNDLTFLKTFEYGFKKATEQEVFEALKNEAVKRGFVIGKYCIHEDPTQDQYNPIKDYFYHERDNCLYGDVENNGGTRIFREGNWATIIPTKTKEEAEKLLNCKIIS